jgi:hypothetical protein
MTALIMCCTGGANFVTDTTSALLGGYFIFGTVDRITFVAVACILQSVISPDNISDSEM